MLLCTGTGVLTHGGTRTGVASGGTRRMVPGLQSALSPAFTQEVRGSGPWWS